MKRLKDLYNREVPRSANDVKRKFAKGFFNQNDEKSLWRMMGFTQLSYAAIAIPLTLCGVGGWPILAFAFANAMAVSAIPDFMGDTLVKWRNLPKTLQEN